jgi:hypothetical protein
MKNLFPDGETEMTQTIDDSVLSFTDDDTQVTTNKLRDHLVDGSGVGMYISASPNSNPASTTVWELGDYDPKLDELGGIVLMAGIIGSYNKIPPTLNGQPTEGQEYWIEYRLKDSDSTGTIGRIDEEFDRYRTKFIIDYMFDDDGTMTPASLDFYAPNSVVKYLMGWDENSPMTWNPAQTINPANNNFVPFFQRVTDLLNNPDYELKRSRLVNRNTPYPYTDPLNPFEVTLAQLDAIAQGDVHEQDELYPTLVTLNMENYGP